MTKNRRDSSPHKKWLRIMAIAQFINLPVALTGTAVAEHKAGIAQHMNLVVLALSEGEELLVAVSALTALILNLDNALAMQPHLTHQNLHDLLILDLGMDTLNWSSAERDKLIFNSLKANMTPHTCSLIQTL